MTVHPGWIQPVVSRSVRDYGRVALELKCGCVVTRLERSEPKRARCELQRGCRWRQEVYRAAEAAKRGPGVR